MINFCFSALPAVFLHVFYMQILILPRLCLICEGPCEREHMWLRLFIMLKCENYAVPCAHFYLLPLLYLEQCQLITVVFFCITLFCLNKHFAYLSSRPSRYFSFSGLATASYEWHCTQWFCLLLAGRMTPFVH